MSNFDIKKVFANDEIFEQMKTKACLVAHAFRAPVIDNNKQLSVLLNCLCDFAHDFSDQLNYLSDVARQNKEETANSERLQKALDDNQPEEQRNKESGESAVPSEQQSSTEASSNDNTNADSSEGV